MTNVARRRRLGVVASVLGALTALVTAATMMPSPPWERAQLAWWEYDGMTPTVMTVAVCGGDGDSIAVRVSETPDAIVLGASSRAPCNGCPRLLNLITIPVEVDLPSPLQGREVVTSLGTSLPRHEPGDPYFDCFD